MKWRLQVIFFVTIFGCGPVLASSDESFLDRRIPFPPENNSCLYLDQLQAIAPVIGKKVIFPTGLIDYVSRAKLNRPSFFHISGSDDHKSTIRDYLNQSQGVVGLNWKYDMAQDAVVYDFAWHQSVSRSGKELVDQLGRLAPAPLDSLHFNSKLELDPWRLSLNELMSEPENFPQDWKVRLEDGCSMEFSLGNSIGFGDADAVYSHILKDSEGKEHLLVLNSHRPLTTKGRSAFVYYLFSADGKWEDGGIFQAGGPFDLPTIKFEPEKNRAMIEIKFTPLKLTDSTGKVTTLPSGYHIGDTLDYLLEINHGKLAASIWTNVSPLPAPLDETFGVTPLRHLGD
jgi:hypothetical protein